MKVKYTKKPKANDFENEKFTLNKEYNVLADYRNRQSGQVVPDNGLVILADNNQQEMVFLSDGFEVSNTDKEETYIFEYSK
jgi:hypothetical protein